MTSAWQELGDGEYDSVWNRFERQFNFRPSVRSELWPGISEPSPSETYSISSIYSGCESHFANCNAEIQDWGLRAFQRLLPSESGWLYALDWQHNCYRFFPHISFILDEFGEWVIPIIPDGDYHIFIERDFTWGIFGHPWEQTMCVFGSHLLAMLRECPPKLLSIPLRTNGQES